MQVIIDIPSHIYKTLIETGTYGYYKFDSKKAIKNGTPLPKGYGRLIDADRTLATAWTSFYKHEDEWEKKDNDYLPIGRLYDQNGFECCLQTIVNAPTIIEASKEKTK